MITDDTMSRYSGAAVKSIVPAQILDGSGFVTCFPRNSRERFLFLFSNKTLFLLWSRKL